MKKESVAPGNRTHQLGAGMVGSQEFKQNGKLISLNFESRGAVQSALPLVVTYSLAKCHAKCRLDRTSSALLTINGNGWSVSFWRFIRTRCILEVGLRTAGGLPVCQQAWRTSHMHTQERQSNSSNGRGEQFLLQYYSIETQQLAVCNSCTQIIHSTDCERYWIRRLNQTTGILVDSRELIHSVLTFCM